MHWHDTGIFDNKYILKIHIILSEWLQYSINFHFPNTFHLNENSMSVNSVRYMSTVVAMNAWIILSHSHIHFFHDSYWDLKNHCCLIYRCESILISLTHSFLITRACQHFSANWRKMNYIFFGLDTVLNTLKITYLYGILQYTVMYS